MLKHNWVQPSCAETEDEKGMVTKNRPGSQRQDLPVLGSFTINVVENFKFNNSWQLCMTHKLPLPENLKFPSLKLTEKTSRP